jgi:hypothetical protein
MLFLCFLFSIEKTNALASPDGSGILCRWGSAGKIERTAGGFVVKKDQSCATKTLFPLQGFQQTFHVITNITCRWHH